MGEVPTSNTVVRSDSPLLPLPVCLVARFALHFCSSACQGWVLCFLPPPSPLSFPLFCRLLVVCSPCLFSTFVVSPVFPLLLVAGCPCSLPPFLPPPVCVCVKPENTDLLRLVFFRLSDLFIVRNRQDIVTFLIRLMQCHSVEHLVQWC